MKPRFLIKSGYCIVPSPFTALVCTSKYHTTTSFSISNMGQRSHAFKIQLGSLGHFKGQTKNILTVLFCWINSLYIFLHIHYRVVHVFVQIRNGSCQWFTYKIENVRNEQWVEKGIFPECSGYKIGETKWPLPLKKIFMLKYKISASIFYKVKGMVLKGVIYIFVHPNTNSVLAFSLKSQQVFEPMDIHHYPSALNVIEMKEIVSFYPWYENFTSWLVL